MNVLASLSLVNKVIEHGTIHPKCVFLKSKMVLHNLFNTSKEIRDPFIIKGSLKSTTLLN
jgi:hypothetical protein